MGMSPLLLRVFQFVVEYVLLSLNNKQSIKSCFDGDVTWVLWPRPPRDVTSHDFPGSVRTPPVSSHDGGF